MQKALQLHRQYTFRLSSDGTAVEFLATTEALKYRLHNAFISLAEQCPLNCAKLEVRHPLHGWRRVCNAAHSYQIIDSPLTLNEHALCESVQFTLRECDKWLTPEQIERKKQQSQIRQRAEIAAARRRSFHLVK